MQFIEDDFFPFVDGPDGTTVPANAVDTTLFKEDETHEEEEEPTKQEPANEPVQAADDLINRYYEFAIQSKLLEVPEDFEFTGDLAQLEQAHAYTEKARDARSVERVFEALPEDFKPLFDYALSGGSSIKDFLDHYGPDALDNFNEDSTSDQKRVLTEHYRKFTNFSDERIERLISLLPEDELKQASLDAFTELKADKEAKKLEFLKQTAAAAEQAKQESEQRALSLSKAIDDTNSIHPQRKNKIKSFFFEPVNVAGEQTTAFNHTIQLILSNPEHQAQLADILLEYNKDEGFTQDRLEKRKTTNASQNFRKLVRTALAGKPQASSGGAPSSNTFDWAAFNDHS